MMTLTNHEPNCAIATLPPAALQPPERSGRLELVAEATPVDDLPLATLDEPFRIRVRSIRSQYGYRQCHDADRTV